VKISPSKDRLVAVINPSGESSIASSNELALKLHFKF